MRRTTLYLAIATEIIILILGFLNPSYVNNPNISYGIVGIVYLAGDILAVFLIIFVIYWIIEKIYDRIRPKAKKELEPKELEDRDRNSARALKRSNFGADMRARALNWPYCAVG